MVEIGEFLPTDKKRGIFLFFQLTRKREIIGKTKGGHEKNSIPDQEKHYQDY